MPRLDQLDAAMGHPERSVPAFDRLGGGQIATAAGGPFRVVGGDSAVYQLRQPNGRVVALRCPLSDTPDPAIADRYHRIPTAPELAPLRDSPQAVLLGQVAYIPEGIRVPGPEGRARPLPVVAMEWVMGPTLLTAVDRACRNEDRPYLAALGETWVRLLDTLGEAGFSHGDLTADNVMVRPGAGFVLIDYDTCAWRGQRGGPIPRGTLGYAHPKHDPAPPPERRDDFAAFVIYTSLRVLAEQPSLREEHGESPAKPGGTLLFSPWDLVNPNTSQLFGSLRGAKLEASTRALVDTLVKACQRPPNTIRPLPEIAREFRPAASGGLHAAGGFPNRSVGGSWSGAQPPQAERPRTQPATREAAAPAGAEAVKERQQRLSRFERMLGEGDERGAHRFWETQGLAGDPEARSKHGPRMREIARGDAIRRAQAAAQSNDTVTFLRLWDDHDLGSHPRGEKLRPVAEVARRRQDAAAKLREALAADDTDLVVKYWPSLRGDSLVADLPIAVTGALQRHFSTRLTAALAQGDDERLIEAVHEAEERGVVLAAPMRRAFREARNRVAIREKLDAAVGAGDRIALADLLISGRLSELGGIGADVQRMALRALSWPHLDRALADDNDEAILGAYDPDLFDAASGSLDPLARRERERVDLARRRLGWLAAVREALRRRDATTLQRVWSDIPAGALDRLSTVERRRAERYVGRDEAARELALALERGFDHEIMSALSRATVGGGSLADTLNWAKVGGVVDRTTLAQALDEALARHPADYARLARLLPAARIATTDPGYRGGVDFARYEREVLRAARLHRLRNALAAGDDRRVVAAAFPDTFGVIDLLDPAERVRVNRAIANRDATDRLGLAGA